MASGSETSDPGMHGDREREAEGSGRLSQPVASPPSPHPALIALVRLLARSAAREAAASGVSDDKETINDY
jgi:hypothetical protein